MFKGRARRRGGKSVSDSATFIQQMDSCLLSSTSWVLGSVLTRVSKNMWTPQGGSSLSLLIHIPNGSSWGRWREVGGWER